MEKMKSVFLERHTAEKPTACGTVLLVDKEILLLAVTEKGRFGVNKIGINLEQSICLPEPLRCRVTLRF